MFGPRTFSSAAIIGALMLMAAIVPQATAAQDNTVTVYLRPVVVESGDTIANMCLKLGDASNTGCDENGDGYIAFQGMHPGTYPVQQETIIAGIDQLGDGVTITVADSPAEQYFTIDFHALGSGDATPVPTVAPTVAPPDSGSQGGNADTGSAGSSAGSGAGSSTTADTTSGTSATAFPNTGTGTLADTPVSLGTISLAALALLAAASLATLTAGILRWRRPRA